VTLPTGSVTFLFSDIEGSTRLAQSMSPDDWANLLQVHDDLVDAAVVGHQGAIVKHEGDGAFAAFAGASDALDAAAALSEAIAAEAWRQGASVRLRIGIHTGSGQLTRDQTDYLGVDVHYAARVAGAGNGGQIVVSEDSRRALDRALPGRATLVSAGPRRLKDFDEPRPVHRLVIPGAADDERPLRAAGGMELPQMLTTFVGRASEVAEISELLTRSRIVTLTGPGGTGKTRLSLGVAEAVVARLGREEADRLMAEGARLTIGEAVELALGTARAADPPGVGGRSP
jgi:class 3 adenylate cyclase